MNHHDIRKEVARLIDRLPRPFREQLRNIAIVVEDRPSRDLLLAEDLDPEEDTLYGLYQGVPLPERSSLDPPLLPDKITIFAEPLLEDFPDLVRTCTRIREAVEQANLEIHHELRSTA